MIRRSSYWHASRRGSRMMPEVSKGYKGVLGDFAVWCTAHGVSHAGSAQNCYLRTFWTVMGLITLGLFIVNFVALIKKFNRHDVIVITSLKFKERHFPAVTVCNTNAVLVSKLENSAAIHKLVGDYRRKLDGEPIVEDPYGFNNITATVTLRNGDETMTLVDQMAVQSHTREVLMVLASQHHGGRIQGLDDITATLDEFVLGCTFKTEPCDMSRDFRRFIDPFYGLCWTFNNPDEAEWTGEGSESWPYYSDRAGSLYGLRLIIKANHSDYAPHSESSGVRVSVHGQGDPPFPDSFGFNAATGYRTSFALQFLESERTLPPLGNCTRGYGPGPYFYGGQYTVEGCVRSCVAQQIIDECGCADARYERPPDDPGLPNCGLTSLPCIQALNDNVRSDDAEDELAAFLESQAKRTSHTICDCPQPCTQSFYEAQASQALWPAAGYKTSFCRESTFAEQGWASLEECREWFGRNSLVIDVFFDRMNYQVLRERQAYSGLHLITDVGGQMGLWMGASLVTVIEIISLIGVCFVYAVSKKDLPKEKSYGDDDGEDKRTPHSTASTPRKPDDAEH